VINAWLEADGPVCIMITGGPGSGKTWLARQLEQSSLGEVLLDPNEYPNLKKGWLATAFYCHTLDEIRSHPHAALEAWLDGLSRRYPEFSLPTRAQIAETFSGNATVGRAIIQLIMQLLEPLKKIAASKENGLLIFLVEGVDERRYSGSQETLLELLFALIRYLPNLRLLITGGSDERISSLLGRGSVRIENLVRQDQDVIGAMVYQRLDWLHDPERIKIAQLVAEHSLGDFWEADLALKVLERNMKEGFNF
jgi:hypothetical protein